MPEIKVYTTGTFNWIDLAATDAEEAKRFYGGLFDWSAHDIPVGPGLFTMLKLGEQEVASLYQLSQQHRAQGVPAHWMSYVAVASADETAARVRLLGGQVLIQPFNVMDLGRMALILDPTGVPLAVWQAGRHIGARLVNEPGALTWVELITSDPMKAGQFYTQLFGWDIQLQETGESVYTTFLNKGRLNAGMRSMTAVGGDNMPQWLVYFGVTDAEASAEKARVLGGEIVASLTDMPPAGRLAIIRDPQGARFALIEGEVFP